MSAEARNNIASIYDLQERPFNRYGLIHVPGSTFLTELALPSVLDEIADLPTSHIIPVSGMVIPPATDADLQLESGVTAKLDTQVITLKKHILDPNTADIPNGLNHYKPNANTDMYVLSSFTDQPGYLGKQIGFERTNNSSLQQLFTSDFFAISVETPENPSKIETNILEIRRTPNGISEIVYIGLTPAELATYQDPQQRNSLKNITFERSASDPNGSLIVRKHIRTDDYSGTILTQKISNGAIYVVIEALQNKPIFTESFKTILLASNFSGPDTELDSEQSATQVTGSSYDVLAGKRNLWSASLAIPYNDYCQTAPEDRIRRFSDPINVAVDPRQEFFMSLQTGDYDLDAFETEISITSFKYKNTPIEVPSNQHSHDEKDNDDIFGFFWVQLEGNLYVITNYKLGDMNDFDVEFLTLDATDFDRLRNNWSF